jgi:lipoprotein-anchoring transpeptidase ErfK/SrfK
MQVRQNALLKTLPVKGIPAEVTVPFTDAIWDPRYGAVVAYRLYYGSVYWVDRVIEDGKGQIWYRIGEESDPPVYFFAHAEHLHVVTPADIEPISPDVAAADKRIDVRIADQVVIAYEHNVPVMMTRAATGAVFPQKDLHTPLGRYFTNYKMHSRHMVHNDRLEENAYDLPGVPWVIFLTTTGVAFHGTYWHNEYGRPRSHGCINLNLSAARWLFRWSLPGVPVTERIVLTRTGTIVDIL